MPPIFSCEKLVRGIFLTMVAESCFCVPHTQEETAISCVHSVLFALHFNTPNIKFLFQLADATNLPR